MAFGGLARPADLDGSAGSAFTLLRVGGWLVAATFALSLLTALLINPILAQQVDDSGAPDGFGALIVLASVMGLLFGFALTHAVLYWIGWTLEAWVEADVRALSSAKALAIVGTVVYGLAALGSLFVLMLGGAWGFAYSDGSTSTSFNTGLLGLPLTVAKLVVAVLLIGPAFSQETAQRFA